MESMSLTAKSNRTLNEEVFWFPRTVDEPFGEDTRRHLETAIHGAAMPMV